MAAEKVVVALIPTPDHVTDGIHQRFELLDVWRLYPVKTQFSMSVLDINPIKEGHVKVKVQVQSRPKPLNQAGRVGVTAPVCAVARINPALLIKWVESARWTMPSTLPMSSG
jgi:hypothetical protein